MLRVFVSYAHEQRSVATNLVATLQAAGFDCFLDEQDLPAGHEYNARIQASVGRSDVFVFRASEQSVEPGCLLSELSACLRWAEGHGVKLLCAMCIDGGGRPRGGQ